MTMRREKARAAREAMDWWQRLSKTKITTAEVYAFRDWRDNPLNDAAYERLQRETPRSCGRYAVQPSPGGFAVIDTAIGDPAKFANASMVDIEVEEANEVAMFLARRDSRSRRVN